MPNPDFFFSNFSPYPLSFLYLQTILFESQSQNHIGVHLAQLLLQAEPTATLDQAAQDLVQASLQNLQ